MYYMYSNEGMCPLDNPNPHGTLGNSMYMLSKAVLWLILLANISTKCGFAISGVYQLQFLVMSQKCVTTACKTCVLLVGSET